ncbi:MAG: hypothetical protein JXB03_05360 [Spirochaetales bacterium]|nr:hypothetical protein [Spirochaetales bacterium]
MDTFTRFEKGCVQIDGIRIDACTLDWNEHPSFKGVYLKHLITGSLTKGRFSSHLVRIDAGAEIGTHVHESQLELHEVIAGSGFCEIENTQADYMAGVCAIIEAAASHRVQAGNGGLYMLAKFIPALV